MSIGKHEGAWRVNVYIGPLADRLPPPYTGKKRLTKVVATRQGAKALEREWEDLKEGIRTGTTGGMTVSAWRKTHLAQDLNPTTLKVYEYATAPFEREHGDTDLASWTPQAAKAACARRPKSQVIAIRRMFQHAVDDGEIPSNPFRDIKTPRKDARRLKADFHSVWPIDPNEQVKLLDHILATAEELFGMDVRGKIAFAAWTGCRPGEIRGLRRPDLDLKEGSAYIRHVIDTLGNEREGTKTGVHRKIVVPPQAIREVRAMTVHLDTPYVFTNAGQPWQKNTFYGRWSAVAMKADLGRMRFYDMRHFCATQLLELGISPEDVAAQLGHTDGGALVRDVYGHPSQERALDRIRHTIQSHTDSASSQVRHTDWRKQA